MTYAIEFPHMIDDSACAEMAKRSDAWEDTSWLNDQCPSFTCDVFVLYVAEEKRDDREFPQSPRFTMHCEDEVMLETDDFADVLAFIDDGKRDFAEYGA